MTNKDHEQPEGQPIDADIPSSPDPRDGNDLRDAAESAVPTENPDATDATDATDTGNAPTGHSSTSAVGTGHDVTRSMAGSTWVALIIGAVILILLLIFILQNGDSAQVKMFFWTWNFPIGVGMLIAAVGGALVAASIGTVRIIQLRHQVRSRG